jgi:hypothetical protein
MPEKFYVAFGAMFLAYPPGRGSNRKANHSIRKNTLVTPSPGDRVKKGYGPGTTRLVLGESNDGGSESMLGKKKKKNPGHPWAINDEIKSAHRVQASMMDREGWVRKPQNLDWVVNQIAHLYKSNFSHKALIRNFIQKLCNT